MIRAYNRYHTNSCNCTGTYFSIFRYFWIKMWNFYSCWSLKLEGSFIEELEVRTKSEAKYLLYGNRIRAAAGWWLFFYVRQLFGAMMIPWHVCCGQQPQHSTLLKYDKTLSFA